MGPGLARAIEKTTNLKIIFSQDIIMLLKLWDRRGLDGMVVGYKLPVQSVPITPKVVSLNPTQARCTRYNIM
jgi:hypothetical protein